MQREIERSNKAALQAQNAAVREQQRAIRETERAAKASARAAAASERERKRAHQEARAADVDGMNTAKDARLDALSTLLTDALAVDHFLDLDDLKESYSPPPFDPGVLGKAAQPPFRPFVPPPPAGAARLRKKNIAAYEESLRAAEERYAESVANHESREARRLERLVAAEKDYDDQVAAEAARCSAQNAEIDRFKDELNSRDPEAIAAYFSLVLQSSVYPDGFPSHSRVAYVPESQQLVVEIDLPTLSVVPDVKTYRYVKTRDDITETKMPPAEVKSIYGDAIAQVALRTIHEVFDADRGRWIDAVVLNGHVDTVDPGTGQDIHPCLLSLRTTKDAFSAIDLARVEPTICLKSLNAAVSRKPTELAPIRPVLEFSMVDPRFVEETDVLSELSQRVNLMELTPFEFENLISNLFERMGLDTRQTQASRDGGVDCIAFDNRPIVGGKVVIQAKRYKNTVGVSAVRDLFGTVQNEGASKGILVTTSGYGPASFEFAEGKPLELLDGPNLLYLLAEHADLEATIEAPADWSDPVEDAPSS
jgi:restriction system protein